MRTDAKLGTSDASSRTAAILATSEIGLGSLLHSYRVPFTGSFLSLNQAFWLARFQLRERALKRVPMTLSNVVAVLKSLSPAGKKLTPMMAISCQGACFSLGLVLGGNNRLGVWMGTLFLSLWSFIQPVLLYFVLYGEGLIEISDYYLTSFSKQGVEKEWLWGFIVFFALVKLFLSSLVFLAALKLSERHVSRFQERVTARSDRFPIVSPGGPVVSLGPRLMLALRDLLNPMFLVSVLLTLVFIMFSESVRSATLWYFLRPLAVGFILFFTVRSIAWSQCANFFESHGFTEFARSFRNTLKYLGGG